MKPNYKVLGSTAALAILVLGFQNCSPVNFGAEEKTTSKSGAVAPAVVDNRPPEDHTNPAYDYEDNSITNPNVPPRSGDVYRAKCAESEDNGFVKLGAYASVSGNASVGKFKAPSFHSISGNYDEMVVLRDGGSGYIDSVSGNIKVLVICGFSMDSFSGNNTTVVFVNSHVEKLSGNRSLIKSVNSTFGSQSGNTDEFVETLE